MDRGGVKTAPVAKRRGRPKRRPTGAARRDAIAAALADGPRSTVEIAARTGMDCDEIGRVCHCHPSQFVRTNPGTGGHRGSPAVWSLVTHAPTQLVVCQHCCRSNVARPRGLCWSCYYTPGVRELYPSTSKYARRGVTNFSGAAPLPTVPTTAAPGTPEKIEVMEQRAKAGQELFHPLDARLTSTRAGFVRLLTGAGSLGAVEPDEEPDDSEGDTA